MAEQDAPRIFVIVGAGQAGGELAKTLRKRGFTGRILLYGAEPHLPYRRPPLSKEFLAGTVKEEGLCLLRQTQIEKDHIEFFLGVRVDRIDRAAHRVHLADGREQHYDKLALTTGGRARPLPLPGADAENVFSMRTIADVRRMRAAFAPGKRFVIIGGGFIGLEVGAVARKLGLEVTVLEGLPRVLARVTCEETSAFFQDVHRGHGVDVRTAARLERFALSADGKRVTAAVLADGTEVPADLVLVGIGQLPNVELAKEAGLSVDNGIVVDACGRTADPDIVAAGDCASYPSQLYGRRLRLESVQNALEYSRTAAAAMLGLEEPYAALPWFWSDQYDVKLQMAGLSTGYDHKIVRGTPAEHNFAIFYLREGVLIAADTVGRAQDFMAAKKLILARAKPDAAQLADPQVALKTLLPA
ncbi:MAG TPA: FAD-dependent oxidoreductase [Nevskiaceae bacterium]|nr:FAD-dependent oxidoreductase [Nevskiaceae bacterium]